MTLLAPAVIIVGGDLIGLLIVVLVVLLILRLCHVI
jgi:hypothetical protein